MKHKLICDKVENIKLKQISNTTTLESFEISGFDHRVVIEFNLNLGVVQAFISNESGMVLEIVKLGDNSSTLFFENYNQYSHKDKVIGFYLNFIGTLRTELPHYLRQMFEYGNPTIEIDFKEEN